MLEERGYERGHARIKILWPTNDNHIGKLRFRLALQVCTYARTQYIGWSTGVEDFHMRDPGPAQYTVPSCLRDHVIHCKPGLLGEFANDACVQRGHRKTVDRARFGESPVAPGKKTCKIRFEKGTAEHTVFDPIAVEQQ